MSDGTRASVGIDTASVLFGVTPAERAKLAGWLPYERGHKLGAKHHYANLDGWSATLHERDFRSDANGSVLVATASLPKLLFNENATPVGRSGASEALSRLCDEIERDAGVCLHQRHFEVCRVDYCVSLSRFAESRNVIGALRNVELPRRQTASLNNGVTFYAKDRKETAYDKLGELTQGASRLARSALNEAKREASASLALDELASRGIAAADLEAFRVRLHVGQRQRDRLAATRRSLRRLGSGALRLEVRLTGSRAIGDALQLVGVDRSEALTEGAAFAVLAPVVESLNAKLATKTMVAAVVALGQALPAVRMQRLIALLLIVRETGSLDLAADALGMSRASAKRVARDGARLGVARLTDIPLTPSSRSTSERSRGPQKENGG